MSLCSNYSCISCRRCICALPPDSAKHTTPISSIIPVLYYSVLYQDYTIQYYTRSILFSIIPGLYYSVLYQDYTTPSSLTWRCSVGQAPDEWIVPISRRRDSDGGWSTYPPKPQ